MNSPLPASTPARRNWTRRLVNVLVALVVVAVAAAAFVFSYDGVHAIALFGGVSSQLARYYPGLFDAVLVIACVAAVMLRDGRWWARAWAWVVIIVLLAAIGTTDVLHAMNYTLRHRPTEGIVAAAPVVAVLLAFSLLLTLLRQSRTHDGEPAVPAPPDIPALPAAVSASPIALPAAPATYATAPTEAMRAPEDWTVPEWTGPERSGLGGAPTREGPAPMADHVVAAVPEVPPPATAKPTHPATQSNRVVIVDAVSSDAPPSNVPASAASAPEVANTGVPTAEVPLPEVAAAGASPALDEPAPPTVQLPAVPTVQVPALSPEPASEKTVSIRRPQGIRYAGSGVPGMAGKQQPAERDVPPGEDYWDTEEAGQFAGLVYRAREDQPDAGDGAGDVTDTETGGAVPRTTPQELDDDAPPFATAPFASVPRLNRVRSTPAPPEDEDEQPPTLD